MDEKYLDGKGKMPNGKMPKTKVRRGPKFCSYATDGKYIGAA